MKVDVTTVSAIKKTLAVEVPPTDVQAVWQGLLRSYARQLRVPGFRPGKAPIELVKARVGKDLGAEAAEKVVERFSGEAIRREGLKPVYGGVSLKLPDGKETPDPVLEGQSYSFTIDVEVFPEINPENYTKLKVARPNVEFDAEQLQRDVEAVRQSFGRLVDINDRASQRGDYVAANLRGVELGGELRLEERRQTIHLGGEGTLPEFDRALSGKRAGDELAFEVNYPQEFPAEDVRGRTVTFAGTVIEVKQAEIPELSDELIKPLGVSSVAELRQKLEARMMDRKNEEADQTARGRLLDRLLDAHPFEAPEALVNQEVQDRLERIGQRLAAQGLDPDKLEIDWKQMLERQREEAIKQVREELLLDAIARKENIAVSKEEMQHAVQQLAHDSQLPARELKERLQQRGAFEAFRAQVLRRKCLDWLYSQADIV
jgi:trigger factor